MMGNYFVALIDSEEDFHWSLIPFILIWVAFVGLLAVCADSTLSKCSH